MKYRLKNQDLQQRIETFLGKEFFDEALRKGNVEDGLLTVYADLSELSYVHIEIDVDDIEAIPEYDPDTWNNYPSVTPPKGVWMRCEFDHPNGRTLLHIARYIEDEGSFYWIDQNMNEIDVSRFRPWE